MLDLLGSSMVFILIEKMFRCIASSRSSGRTGKSTSRISWSTTFSSDWRW
jgi:hypothetical protein